MEGDTYKTISVPAQAQLRERSSKFLSFAFPVSGVEEIKPILDDLRKKYYDATHHCFAYRLGAGGEIFRVNDDGEPSGTAGRPILGQMLSAGITDCLIVVVRYFGGTKLGVPGLIAAYKDAAADVISVADVVERTVDTIFEIAFSYVNMNEVMKIVKEEQPRIVAQSFDNLCTMILVIRRSCADILDAKLLKVEGVQSVRIEKEDAAAR